MSGLELNKIAAAILIASLIAMLVGVVANILYKPKLEVTQRGYEIKVTEGGDSHATTDTKAAPINIEELMKTANAEAGSKTIKKCIACHTLDKGEPHKIGPNLWNVVDSPKGKTDFAYSKAMQAAGGTWDKESLFTFLHKPGQYIPGTKMSFIGIKEAKDIADVIAYLKEKAG